MEEQKNIDEKNEPISKGKKKIKLSTLIIVSVIALLVGALIMFLLSITGIFSPSEFVARVNGKNYSANDVDKLLSSYLGDDMNMKISLLLDNVDYEILNEKYPLTDKDKEELESYIMYYTAYYGLSEEYAKQYLTIAKLRESYYLDYLSQYISDEDINKYYENDFISDIECQHILVQPDDENLTKEQALTVANEIIKNLNSGKSFEEVITEYKNSEKYSDFIVTESFTCKSMSSDNSDTDSILYSDLESTFVDGLLALENNTFTTTPVETSYGYHVIYRKNQAEKPALNKIKDDIVKVLSEEYASSEKIDSTLYSQLLIDLRKENGFNIYDSDLKKAYEEYCKAALEVVEEENIEENEIAE